MNNGLNPRVRLIVLIVAVSGTLLANNLALVLGALCGVLLPLLIMSRVIRVYLRFLAAVIGPIAIGLLFIWGYLVGATPNQVPHSDPRSGFAYAALTASRLAMLGGIVQLVFLTIPAEKLAGTLKYWGVRHDGLIIALSAYALVPEMKLRASQIYNASCARGLISHSIWSRVRQFPYIIRGLVIWSIRSSLQRSELWLHRGLLDLGEEDLDPNTALRSSRRSNVSFMLLSIAWLVLVVISRIHGFRWVS